MSAIHDLIAQISDPRLRERLAAEWASASQEKKFGLVFEEHLPELLPLHGTEPRRGDLVCRKFGQLKDVWQVLGVREGVATCVKPQDGNAPSGPVLAASESVFFALDELLVVREFGEPIFPALLPVDMVTNGPPDSPWHTLIEADNYHALQLLDYLYASQVDCIYIDPPYNTGARDWKYNNDYVDGNDSWRHSKWLSMMRRRLLLAKQLLRPDNSVLLVTIDDHEVHSLSLLLEQLFPECERQMVSITISPRGKSRDRRLSQVDEYLIVVYVGAAGVSDQVRDGSDTEVRWRYLRRNDVESARGTSKGGPNQFYPIYVDEVTSRIVSIGAPLDHKQDLSEAPAIAGAVAVFPIREDGKHMNWGITVPSLRRALDSGYVRVTPGANGQQRYTFAYLTAPNIKKVDSGVLRVIGVRSDGSKIVVIPGGKESRPTTAWRRTQHDAGAYGTGLLRAVLPDRPFPFPKSIYSVADTLRLFINDKPKALIVDFFAGSGTTLNAVNLLNAADGGQRRCVLVTNNEVSIEEAVGLRAQGLQPGDIDWEASGICRSVTWPRSKFTILGCRDDGTPLPGDYLTGRTVEKEKTRSFTQIGFVDAAMLDTKAKKKQVVALIDGLPQILVTDECSFIVSEDHKISVLFDTAATKDWLDALDGQEHITSFYIVTPLKKVFDSVKAQVNEVLGLLRVREEESRPMSAGFPSNLAYFKLDFLEKDRVALKRAFREILPLLWLKAGALCPLPELPKSAPEPVVFAPEGCNFAVLLDEGCLNKLLKTLAGREGLSHVFIVTDADESFKAMATDVWESLRDVNEGLHVVQLYRDYLVNFMINLQQDRAAAMGARK